MNTSRRVTFLLLCSFLMTAAIATAQPVVDAETKPFIGTWSGKENPQLGLPAPRIKIQKDGKLVWRQIRLPAGVKTEGREFEKVPSDF